MLVSARMRPTYLAQQARRVDSGSLQACAFRRVRVAENASTRLLPKLVRPWAQHTRNQSSASLLSRAEHRIVGSRHSQLRRRPRQRLVDSFRLCGRGWQRTCIPWRPCLLQGK
eukprot:5358588-Pleurochrysis_carterae.AAC.2